MTRKQQPLRRGCDKPPSLVLCEDVLDRKFRALAKNLGLPHDSDD